MSITGLARWGYKMNAKRFFSYLHLLCLPKEVVSQKGLGNEFHGQQLARTDIFRRTTPLVLDDAPEDIQALFRDYDLSFLNMLWTTFLPEPTKVPEGWHFANILLNRVVRVPCGRIEAFNDRSLETTEGDHQFTGTLAVSMDAYLDALFCGALFRKHFATGFADQPTTRQKLEPVAQLCTVFAGGAQYEEFWAGVLGLRHE